MSESPWHRPGEKKYSSGIDRGMVYPHDITAGVPWNGLISVEMSGEGGSLEPVFVNGRAVTYDITPGRLKAVIEAFHYPDEFGEHCLGEKEFLYTGVSLWHQPRGKFDLAYRQHEGDDLNEISKHYKLVLVYNAVAMDSGRQHSTVSDSVTPETFSWDIETSPIEFDHPEVDGDFLPSAVLTIDTRKIPLGQVRLIEDILYANIESRIPTLDEMWDILSQVPPIVLTNYAENPSAEADEVAVVSQRNLATHPRASTLWYDSTYGDPGTPILNTQLRNTALAHLQVARIQAGMEYELIKLRTPTMANGGDLTSGMAFSFAAASGGSTIYQVVLHYSVGATWYESVITTAMGGVSTNIALPNRFTLYLPWDLPSGITNYYLEFHLYGSGDLSYSWLAVGALSINTGADYFDGNFNDAGGFQYRWEGASYASPSTKSRVLPFGTEIPDNQQAIIEKSADWSSDRESSFKFMNASADAPKKRHVVLLTTSEFTTGGFVLLRGKFNIPVSSTSERVHYGFELYHGNTKLDVIENKSLLNVAGTHDYYVRTTSPVPSTQGEFSARLITQSTPEHFSWGVSPNNAIYVDDLVLLRADTSAALDQQLLVLDSFGGYFDGESTFSIGGSTEWSGTKDNSISHIRSWD